MPTPVRCTIMRGGTSKGIFLRECDLPTDPARRDATILRIFGSPDKRQIDGLGGADPLTSKCCIIGPPPRNHPRITDAHLSYTFAQVEINQPHVDRHGICGNLTSAVAAFAIWDNMVEVTEPVTQVRIFNTNTGRLLIADVEVADGRPVETGNYAIPGVPGTGSKMPIDFSDTVGAKTGALLPTGNTRDTLDVPGVGKIDASLVDAGNPLVFVRAADMGLKGTETAAAIDADKALCEKLERIRSEGAVVLGLAKDRASATRTSPGLPMIAMVAPPQDYENGLVGGTVAGDQCDFLSRLMFMQQMHKTYAGTATVCTGVASRLPGTIVHEMCRPQAQERLNVRFGHPAGIIDMDAAVELAGNTINVTRAAVARTARRIMDGTVYVP